MKRTKKLNPNAQKWVRALRSGKYRQGKRRLHAGNRFCCLGVACELALANGVELHKSKHFASGAYRYGDNEDLLPLEVERWLGLNTIHGWFERPHADPDIDLNGCHSLVALNDAGASFRKIASIIESKPPGLFDKGS